MTKTLMKNGLNAKQEKKISTVLKQKASGRYTTAELAEKHSISPATIFNWANKHTHLQPPKKSVKIPTKRKTA